jgi:hypothetical protein
MGPSFIFEPGFPNVFAKHAQRNRSAAKSYGSGEAVFLKLLDSPRSDAVIDV